LLSGTGPARHFLAWASRTGPTPGLKNTQITFALDGAPTPTLKTLGSFFGHTPQHDAKR